MRCHAWRGRRSPGQFQSAPGREAGRCGIHAVKHGGVHVFQSAPGREAGRCPGRRRGGGGYRCFNPRPAVRPGDALALGNRIASVQLVSIRARP